MTQKEALNLLMMGRNVLLTGQAGSGKTYLLCDYIDFLKKNAIGVAITASTGIAATHLNGTTIHSWSGIGIKNHLEPHDLSKIMHNINTRDRIQSAKVLIIDEISMLDSSKLDMVNQVCKMVRQNPQPFGGLQVILCGDFFQLPPIIDKKENPQSSFAYKSSAWEELNLTICYLDEQHRQVDEAFLKVLNEIRSQEVSEYTFEKLSSRLNKNIQSKIKPTSLYTHNEDVDAINNFELDKINKPKHVYEMTSRGKEKLVEMLKKGCQAPETLIIKEGAVVMFVKNNKMKGYVNGTLGKVIDFDENEYPIVETFSGQEIVASPTSWSLEENDLILAEINQVPLRLAWAITVHKSQGMSLDAAEIDLSKSFDYGMGYVALSRVRSLDGIRLLGINQTALEVDREIAEMDIVLKKLSDQSVKYLKSLKSDEISRKQKEFLKNITSKEQTTKNTKSESLFSKFFSS